MRQLSFLHLPSFLYLTSILLCTLTAPANAQTLHQIPTHSKHPKGTFLLLSGADYRSPQLTAAVTRTLDTLGYNTATLESPIVSADSVQETLRLLRTKSLQGQRLGIIGFASGACLAAFAIRQLDENQQPDDLLLISPTRLEATLRGTVLPAVMPPLHPAARLLTIVSANDSASRAAIEYTKTWKGYDGIATFQPLTTDLSQLIKAYLQAPPGVKNSTTNPAAIPVAGRSIQRHKDKLAEIAKEKFDLIMIGNSITNNFDKPEYQPVWQQFFAPRKTLNLGFSGYRTENICWNIQNGELEGQSPKVVVLEIGTNNVDEKNYPTRHTAGQLAGGIEAIVQTIRTKLPATKILLLRCFPGCYGGPNPTSHRAILERASDIVSRLADNKNIFYCDVNHVFLNLDGSINHDMMPDWLHPSPAGAMAWARAMEPLLSQLMGDTSLDKDLPANTAVIPVSKLEEDSYDWWARHAEVLRIKDSINPGIVLIGNSITHFWGGLPQLKYPDGRLRTPNGGPSWSRLFDNHRVLNLGFGWDRTQNVLWRLDHGELDGLHPRLVIVDIGTNNTSQTAHARMNTAPEIVEGIRAVCGRIRSKIPGANILLMGIFPREEKPDHPRRLLINEVNRLLQIFAQENEVNFLNIGARFLGPDGVMLPGLTSDFTHPTDKGYQIWADAIKPFVDQR